MRREPISIDSELMGSMPDMVQRLYHAAVGARLSVEVADFKLLTGLKRYISTSDEVRGRIARCLYWETDLPACDIAKALGYAKIEYIPDLSRKFIVTCPKCREEFSIGVKNRTHLRRLKYEDWARVCPSCSRSKELEDHEYQQRQREQKKRAESRQRELNTMSYDEYLQSPEWQEIRKSALKRARYHCQLCDGDGVLHVHHRTYDIVRGQEYGAVIVLCENCHRTFHGIDL